jgi:hypothetical protein
MDKFSAQKRLLTKEGSRLSGGKQKKVHARQGAAIMQKHRMKMVNMGVEPRTLALLAPRSKPTELIDLI